MKQGRICDKIILQSSPVLIFFFLLEKANILIASLPVNYNCAKKKKKKKLVLQPLC